MLEEYAGKDATNEFDEFGHSSDAKKQMKEFLLGELEDVSISSLKKEHNITFEVL